MPSRKRPLGGGTGTVLVVGGAVGLVLGFLYYRFGGEAFARVCLEPNETDAPIRSAWRWFPPGWDCASVGTPPGLGFSHHASWTDAVALMVLVLIASGAVTAVLAFVAGAWEVSGRRAIEVRANRSKAVSRSERARGFWTLQVGIGAILVGGLASGFSVLGPAIALAGGALVVTEALLRRLPVGRAAFVRRAACAWGFVAVASLGLGCGLLGGVFGYPEVVAMEIAGGINGQRVVGGMTVALGLIAAVVAGRVVQAGRVLGPS